MAVWEGGGRRRRVSAQRPPPPLANASCQGRGGMEGATSVGGLGRRGEGRRGKGHSFKCSRNPKHAVHNPQIGSTAVPANMRYAEQA